MNQQRVAVVGRSVERILPRSVPFSALRSFLLGATAGALLGACSPNDLNSLASEHGAGSGSPGVAGKPGSAGSLGTTSGSVGSGGRSAAASTGTPGQTTSGAGASNVSGQAPVGSGGAPAVEGGAGSPSESGLGGSSGDNGGLASTLGGAPGASGTAGGSSHTVDHCLYGYDPEPTDDTMAYGPAEFLAPGVTDQSQVDLILQPEILDWFHAHNWEDVHVEWHAIRTCNISSKGQGTLINICQYKQLIPSDQNCQTSGDGYQFLLAHRHMIQILSQLWPKHAADFKGFDHFPQSAADVPTQWQSAWKPWSATTLQNGLIGDNIDQPENLAKFPDEGSLGFWLQCLAGQTLPNRSDTIASGGIHFDLHGQWVRTCPSGVTCNQHALNNGNANVDNYMFYKIHGWIDGVWAKYRKAKGLSDDDPKFKADLLAQCREMDTEEQLSIQALGAQGGTGAPVDNTPLPVESGFFHEQVRPIFENATNKCSGCHSETGPSAGMSLGGHVSSLDIVNGLVNQPAIDGGQFMLVAPGDPDHSWLYLKAAGLAPNANCSTANGNLCITAVMPPNGSGATTVTVDQLATLKQWISDGAPLPTEVSPGSAL